MSSESTQVSAGAVRYEVVDRVAVITIDNPPVNALSAEVWEGIDRGVALGVADPGVDAIVLIGAGTTFIAGADIKGFDALTTPKESMNRSEGIHALLRRIEDAGKPVVAAIHGNALGGGLEVAQACHFRVAARNAKVGQPEVLLGIIPGAGGTQRLPRLAGVRVAIEMCTAGKPIAAPQAQSAGIIDQVTEPGSDNTALRVAAVELAKKQGAARKIRRTREIALAPDAVREGLAACSEAEAHLSAGKGGREASMAPVAAVQAIAAGLELPFETGSIRERELFADCVVSTQSKALRHLFFAERDVAKVPGVTKETQSRDIRRAAVVGAGTMGGGIAMTYANAGIPVLLKDVDQAAVGRGLATIRSNYHATVSKGKMTDQELHERMGLITPTTTYEDFENVDIVVEAVFENLDLKRSTFKELGSVTRGDCILASNSSTLDIDEFAKASGRPAAVLGHHFFSPANVMKLLEIVRGRETSPETLATSLKLAKRLGKVGVVVGNCFGFVANRMLAYYMREAYLLLEEGASVPQIDRAMVDFGMPVGPFAMQDIAGIDVGARIRQYLSSLGKTRAEGPQSPIPDRLFEMGRYGQKTGAGWYKYDAPGSRNRAADNLIEQLAEARAAERGIARRSISDEEIVARITTALANEGARIVEEGFATRAGDIDVIYVYGFGFPRYRGGPMFYAGTLGLGTVLGRVQEYRARFGDYWVPAPMLERLAAEQRTF